MGTVSTFTFTSTTETVTKDKLNNLVALLLAEFNGSIENANIAAGAAIAASKLNLATIAQNVAFTGTLDFSSATVTAAWTAAALTVTSLTATSADINGGTLGPVTVDGKITAGATEIEGSNFDIDGGDISAGTISGSLTWSAAQDLNSQALTNVDINSGNIGGITFDGALTMSLGSDADGDVYYRASNVLTRLAKGTAGQALLMNSGATAPEWKSAVANWVSTTTWSATTTSGNITIAQGSKYLAVVQILSAAAADATITLEFNEDTGAHYANATETVTTSNNISLWSQGQTGDPADSSGSFVLDTVNSDQMMISGEAVYVDTAAALQIKHIAGWWDNSDTVTSFRIQSSQNTTGEVNLYKFNLA